MNGITVKSKLSLVESLADQYNIEPVKFLKTVKDTVFPDATDSELALFLMVAKKYNLNPLMREIHPFKGKGKRMHIIVGVDGWSKIVNTHKRFDGMELLENFNDDKTLNSVTCKMYIKNKRNPVVITEYYDECKADTDPWKRWPCRMLRHKAFIQCARMALGLTEVIDSDEAERIKNVENIPDTFRQDAPREQNPELSSSEKLAKKMESTETIDTQTGEILPGDYEYTDQSEAGL